MSATRSNGKRRSRHRFWAALPLLLAFGWLSWRGVIFRDALVVWSCGGNYESLQGFIRKFEREEGVRVRYTAAPVTYLLGLAVEVSHPPDVLVGRGGPGWLALEQRHLLLAPPAFFAVDPLVIAVPRGNPAGVTSIEDLGRPGVRIAATPGAMRPKGKVPALFMAAVSKRFHPGLVERWEANRIVAGGCGRDLLAPLLEGRADAALVPSSLLTYPRYRGKLERIEIPPKYILAMKKGRPSIPQCAAAVKSGRGSRNLELARRFVRRLGTDRHWLRRHGYLPLDDPYALALAPLLKITAPRDMAGWQMALANELLAAGEVPEARRRYLKVLYTFGPSRYDADALFQSARISRREGAFAAARDQWHWLLAAFRQPRPAEYDSPVLRLTQKKAPVKALRFTAVAERSRELLEQTGDSAAVRPAVQSDPLLRALFPMRVLDTDAPKNGKRDFALGLHLMWVGDYDYATRDLLKVVTLHYPCRFAPQAEYLLGLCAAERGLPAVAEKQWQRVMSRYPETRAARLAERALRRGRANRDSGSEGDATALPAMPPRAEAFETHADRSMTYGMRLYEHSLPLFCFKEMMKIASGVYGPHRLGAELRTRAGVACLALGHADAARRQWLLVDKDRGNNSWVPQARAALKALPPAAVGAEAVTAPKVRVPCAKGSWCVRFRVAEEFRLAGTFDRNEQLLEYLKVCTVAHPPKTPAGRRVFALAEVRVAECLVHAGRKDLARERCEWVRKQAPDSDAARLAGRILEKLSTGEKRKSAAVGQGQRRPAATRRHHGGERQ